MLSFYSATMTDETVAAEPYSYLCVFVLYCSLSALTTYSLNGTTYGQTDSKLQLTRMTLQK